MGTQSSSNFSNGNTLPITALPWGTHHLSPVNNNDRNWFFGYHHHQLQGLRLTHLPSPWMGDWCFATFMAQRGPRHCRAQQRAIPVPSADLDVHPHYCRLPLPAHGLNLAATPVAHGFWLRIERPISGPCRLIIDLAHTGDQRGTHATNFLIDAHARHLQCTTAAGSDMHADFVMSLSLRSSHPIMHWGIFDDTTDSDGASARTGAALGAWIEFGEGSDAIDCHIGASFIDAAHADAHLQRELTPHLFTECIDQAEQRWNSLLDRIELHQANDQHEQLLRSTMYRALLFPRHLEEATADGTLVHRCPDTGRIESGVRITDNGFWDTARSVYPWLALVFPDYLGVILQGWIAGAQSSGWLASWASPGHRACMTGSYADAIFADAAARGITGWDRDAALFYARKHAEVVVPDDAPYGRIAYDAHLRHGYVPQDRCPKATARTLDYAYGDWCLGQLATAVGDVEFAALSFQRADAWQQVLNPNNNFFTGRLSDGTWPIDFDPLVWGGPYVEGSAWQFAWHVPHDPQAVIAARGGATAVLTFLNELFFQVPAFKVGTYGTVIHEMAEMASVPFGQYAHSNQPSHFTLPYFAHCGDVPSWNYWIHRVRTELYAPTPEGYPGDEDNGEMSAWWINASLGLVADCPGSDSWLTVQPLFDWTLRRPGFPDLTIRSTAQRDQASTWQHNSLPAVATGSHMPHAALNRGGEWHIC